MDTNVVQIAAVAAATIAAAEAIDLWDAFWTLVPRHEAKKDARKAWDHLTDDEKYRAVVAIADWRHVWKMQNREIQHIPLPGTWLRGARFEDEIPPGMIPKGARSQVSQSGLPTYAQSQDAHANKPPPKEPIPAYVLAQIQALKEKARVRP